MFKSRGLYQELEQKMIYAIVGSGVTLIAVVIVIEVLVARANRKFKRVMGDFVNYSKNVQDDLMNQAKKEIEKDGMQMRREKSRDIDRAVH